MSYCAKRPPPYSSSVEAVGFYTNSSGVRSRNSAYDSSREYLKDRLWSSVKTVNYKRLKERDLPVNRYQSYTGIISDSLTKIKRKNSPEAWEGYSRMVVGTSHTALLNVRNQAWTSTFPIARDQAVNSLLTRIGNLKFNAAQAFAERKKTADMLIRTVNRFITFGILFRKGRFVEANKILMDRPKNLFLWRSESGKVYEGIFQGVKKSRRAFFSRDHFRPLSQKDFANAWLETSYGWRPLLSDIYGAAELLAEQHTESRPTRSVGRGKQEKDFTYKYTTEGLTGESRGHAEVKCMIIAYYDVASQYLDLLRSTGIANPGLLAWEVLPLSFVFDWFIPVGKYLEAVNATMGLEFKKASIGFLSKIEAEAFTTSNETQWILTGTARMQYDYAEYSRSVLTDFPTAALPSVSMGLNVFQVLSGMALLQQRFGAK